MTERTKPANRLAAPSEAEREFNDWIRRAAAGKAASRLTRWEQALFGVRSDESDEAKD